MGKKILNTLKYNKNPRTITKKQFSLLKEHLEELGDLSGVVYDINSKMYVGGNQRSEVFNGADIEIVERFDPPTPQHTTAHGFIKYLGEKYTYREVSFTPEQFEKACIVANHDGGKWDMDILANEFEMENLLDWGFEEFEFGICNENEVKEEEATQEKKDPKAHVCPNCGCEFSK